MIDALLKASLTYHIRSRPKTYRNCRTSDCNYVYLRNGSYEIFTYPTCLTQTCTLCHVESHVGWTREEYESHIRKNETMTKVSSIAMMWRAMKVARKKMMTIATNGKKIFR